jgi:hypothetical protein
MRRQSLSLANIVIGPRDFPAFGGRNARLAASFGESFSKPIAVIAPVSDQGGGWRQIGKDQPRTLMIAHLALAEHEDEGLAFAVADRVELRVEAAFGAPDAAG